MAGHRCRALCPTVLPLGYSSPSHAAACSNSLRSLFHTLFSSNSLKVFHTLFCLSQQGLLQLWLLGLWTVGCAFLPSLKNKLPEGWSLCSCEGGKKSLLLRLPIAPAIASANRPYWISVRAIKRLRGWREMKAKKQQMEKNTWPLVL